MLGVQGVHGLGMGVAALPQPIAGSTASVASERAKCRRVINGVMDWLAARSIGIFGHGKQAIQLVEIGVVHRVRVNGVPIRGWKFVT